MERTEGIGTDGRQRTGWKAVEELENRSATYTSFLLMVKQGCRKNADAEISFFRSERWFFRAQNRFSGPKKT